MLNDYEVVYWVWVRNSGQPIGDPMRRNIAESFNPLSRAHKRYRRQTDDRRIWKALVTVS